MKAIARFVNQNLVALVLSGLILSSIGAATYWLKTRESQSDAMSADAYLQKQIDLLAPRLDQIDRRLETIAEHMAAIEGKLGIRDLARVNP